MGYGADWPQRVAEDERRRRRLAERLASALAHAPADPGGVAGEFVASTAMRVRFATAFDAQDALYEAPTMISNGRSESIGQVHGPGGVVMWVHGPSDGLSEWSVVFSVRPFIDQILVCVDDLTDHCMLVYDDGPQAREAIENFRLRVTLALDNRRDHVAAGSLPPDPAPLVAPD